MAAGPRALVAAIAALVKQPTSMTDPADGGTPLAAAQQLSHIVKIVGKFDRSPQGGLCFCMRGSNRGAV
jgi:hypothetical protein